MTGKMGTPLRRRLSRLSSLPMLLPRITEAAMIADWTTWLVIVAAVLIFWCLRGSRIRSEEHTSELQSLMRISYAVFCLKKKTKNNMNRNHYKQKQQIHTTHI